MTQPSPSAIFDRLASYEARGWLSRTEYIYYRQMLKSSANVKEVSRQLDQVAEMQQEHSFGSSSQASSSSILKTTQSVASSQQRHVSWEDNASEPCSTTSTAEANKGPTCILEPSDLWSDEANIEFTDEQLQELFVDMCFFARLGFVQPPCCLKCTYREAVRKQKQSQPCERWIVWRRDAKVLIHPNRMDGNIVLIQCHIAEKLLAGEIVEGRVWDSANQQLLYGYDVTQMSSMSSSEQS